MASVTLIRNVGLNDAATGPLTSTTNEPTAASFLDHVFVTGNDFASHSSDGGATWTFVDPRAEFPNEAGGFAGDQKVLHDRAHNLWIWVFQYRVDANGSNFFRLAVSTSGSPASRNWVSWAFSPGMFDSAWATNVQFDRPDIATSNNNLYLTYNMFRGTAFVAGLVIKFSLRDLAKLRLRHFYYVTPEGSLCLTRGATTEMFMMAAADANPVTILRWPDADGAVLTRFRVSTLGAWAGSSIGGTFSSPGPGGVEWLGRLDSRPMAGWVVGSRIGFLWSAFPTSVRPQPWIKGMVVDTNTNRVVAEPDVFSLDVAWAYSSACPNAAGTVGLSIFYGGGGVRHPAHVVGFLEGATWVLAIARESTHGPLSGAWGDYLSCATHSSNTIEWVAAGYTLQGGSSLRAVEPQYVRFGVGP